MNDTARGSLAFVIVALLAFGLWSLVASGEAPPIAEGSAVRWERSEVMAGEIAGVVEWEQASHDTDVRAFLEADAAAKADAARIAQEAERVNRSRRRPAEQTAKIRPASGEPEATTGGEERRVSSTAYCLTSRTASGGRGYVGSVAMNGVPIGSRWQVDGGGTYTVNDRIGHGSGFDVWMPSCAAALEYGRRTITVRRVE